MITIVDCDDWMGLYVEGELKAQGHNISIRDVVYAILREYPEVIEPPYEFMTGRSDLPHTLEEVKEGIKNHD